MTDINPDTCPTCDHDKTFRVGATETHRDGGATIEITRECMDCSNRYTNYYALYKQTESNHQPNHHTTNQPNP